MVGLPRLKNLRRLAQVLDHDSIPGDIVECGTCRGGSGALLALAGSQSGFHRHTWLLDSFQGLPASGERDGQEALRWTGSCRGSVAAVNKVLAKLRVPSSSVTILPGWFSETLSSVATPQIALLHVDADWYESVRQVLEALFDRVVAGGFIVFDDYGYWKGSARAWQEFRAERGLSIEPTDIDGTGAYMRLPDSWVTLADSDRTGI